jgi:hypothetical protein
MVRRKRVATITDTGNSTGTSTRISNKKRSTTVTNSESTGTDTGTCTSVAVAESTPVSVPERALQNEPSSNKEPRKKPSSMKKRMTSSRMNDNTDSDDNDEEIRICNERIRHANAVEFLHNQQQRIKQIYCNNKDDNTNTNIISISVTRNMVYILQQMQHTCCTCTICHCIYNQPITLSNCAHTFCKSCIHAHCDHSWYCPSYVELKYTCLFMCICMNCILSCNGK